MVDDFIAEAKKIRTLEELNYYWSIYLEEYYHNRSHEGIREYYRSLGVSVPEEGISPLQEFNRDNCPLVFLDTSVVGEAFLYHESRKVDKGGCISFQGRRYETKTQLIGRTVEIAYAPSLPEIITVTAHGMEPFQVRPLKIDISPGDVITPREIKYKFNLMLEDRTIEVWAYNLETVLAEKLETVVSRNVTNTRMRDFYDIYILQKLYGEQLQKQVLWTALVATAKKRGTLDLIEAEDIREIFDEIESSPVMETLWKTYQKNYSYAADIPWHTIMKSICALYGSILENMYDT